MAKKPKAPKPPREIEVGPPEEEQFLRHAAPIALSALVGHSGPARLLQNTLKSGRVHHAWIFHGPQGVGKCTAALAFAALLLDPTTQATFGGGFEADPSSITQQLLKAGTHPDLRVIVKELAKFSEDSDTRKSKQTSIPIGVLRDFMLEPGSRSRSVKTASMASKVFIVDEAELLLGPAQNSLLKMLEEPAPGVVIILVTSAEEYLLPTIRSRAQRVYFAPLSQPEMHTWFKSHLFDPLLTPEEEKFLIEFSGGAPGSFVAAHEGKIFSWWQHIGAMLVAAEKGQYSTDFGPAMHELVGTYAREWVEVHENASKESANKDAAAWMFKLVGSYINRRLREAARLANGPQAVKPYLVMLDKVREAEAEMDSNVNQQFVMEKLAAELASALEMANSK